MKFIEQTEKIEESIKEVITEKEKLEKDPKIQSYLKLEQHLKELNKKMETLSEIQYSQAADCYYSKPMIGKDIHLNGIQRINLSMILARILIEKYNSKVNFSKMIFLTELEDYSKIANQILTEEKLYEDDPISLEESKVLQMPVYKNPSNNICYVFNNTAKERAELKKELERNAHNMSKNINTKYLEQGYLLLNNNVPIELLAEQYGLEDKSSRIKEALSSPQSLKTIKITPISSPKKKVYHQ